MSIVRDNAQEMEESMVDPGAMQAGTSNISALHGKLRDEKQAVGKAR